MATGRPCKLNKKVQEVICEGIELGLTYELAAAFGGISYETFRRWMADGQDAKNGIFRAFYVAVKTAEAKGAAERMSIIRKAAKEGHWQAAAWTQERRYPQMYGRRVQEIQGKDGEAIKIKLEWPGANGNGDE